MAGLSSEAWHRSVTLNILYVVTTSERTTSSACHCLLRLKIGTFLLQSNLQNFKSHSVHVLVHNFSANVVTIDKQQCSNTFDKTLQKYLPTSKFLCVWSQVLSECSFSNETHVSCYMHCHPTLVAALPAWPSLQHSRSRLIFSTDLMTNYEFARALRKTWILENFLAWTSSACVFWRENHKPSKSSANLRTSCIINPTCHFIKTQSLTTV
jgi:hypothetical protein